jgi:orotate phosphoribosyltransferase
MTFTSAAKPRLVELVKELAVVHGKVTLSSGIEADYYVDLRRATLHHEAAPLIGQVMLDMLDAAGVTDFVAVGGLTMGADPVATAIMHQAAARGRAIDAFVVRKAAKAHGMGRQVEGPDVRGKRVVVVEDTSTTGGSPLTAAEALVSAGAIVVAVATVVDRSTGAQKIIEDAGFPYYSAIGLTDLNLG